MTQARPVGTEGEATGVEVAGRSRIGWRQMLRVVVGLGLAAVLLVWGLPFFAQTTWGAVFDVIADVPLERALLFTGLAVAALVAYTFTLSASLPGLSHPRALVVNVCGSSVSNLLPAGGAVGLAATYYICRSWGFRIRDVSTSALVTLVWNTLARIALPLIAIVLLALGRTELPDIMRNAAIGATLTGLALVSVFVAFIVSEGAAHRIGRSLDRLLRPLTKRLDRAMSLDAMVTDIRARIIGVVRGGWIQLTLGMVGLFGIQYVLFWFIMETTGLELFHGELFAAFAIGRLLTSIGVTPGGVGVTETGTVAALVAWGAPSAEALAGVVLFSIFTHLIEVPLGALGWLAWSASAKSEPPPAGAETS